jgi:hypothetical protein
MFLTEDSGDSVCFTCGNVVYAVVVPPLLAIVPRRASHAGSSLS